MLRRCNCSCRTLSLFAKWFSNICQCWTAAVRRFAPRAPPRALRTAHSTPKQIVIVFHFVITNFNCVYLRGRRILLTGYGYGYGYIRPRHRPTFINTYAHISNEYCSLTYFYLWPNTGLNISNYCYHFPENNSLIFWSQTPLIFYRTYSQPP